MFELASANWTTLSSLATALGTLVLGVATFAAVRSSNRSARISEMALQEQRRPVLTHSRLTDPPQKMMFADRRWVNVDGGRATAQHIDGVIYLTISLRNVGSGMAVCQGWTVAPTLRSMDSAPGHAPLDQFRAQTRDMYIPAGDIGMWQGALRDPNDPEGVVLAEAIDNAEAISIELLYTDLVGGQRTVTRFGLLPGHEDTWYSSMSRHWHLDSDGPRSDPHVSAATREILGHVSDSGQIEPNDVVQ
jgi:hypothetical protein